MIKMIACVSNNYALGKDNKLLYEIKDDLQHFKNYTLGQNCIFGRKTFDSIIERNGKLLGGRTSVVLTSNEEYESKHGELSFTSVERILNHYSTNTEEDKDIVICGGGEIYRLFAPYADEVSLTVVKDIVEDADTFFPYDMLKEYNFKLIESDIKYCNVSNLCYTINRYRKGDVI